MEENYPNRKQNTFFINTLIIVSSGFIIKILGLFNRIMITRLLGTEGMSLYILSFPTIVLFINISSFSLNVSTSKLVAESIKTHQYSPKLILRKSFKLALIISALTIFVFLLVLYPLVSNWLHNQQLFFPLLTTVILIPLVGICDTLKGYYHGLKRMGVASSAALIEQVVRISFGITTLILLRPYGLILATSFALLALSLGELSSIIFLLIKIKKFKPPHYITENKESKAIIAIALPTTATRLVGSFTFFLEPIAYTAALLLFGYQNDIIQRQYTIINAYSIPLITTVAFLSVAIATSIIPSVSENYALGKFESIRYVVKKGLLFAFVPGIVLSILFFSYPQEYMKLVYNTTEGSSYVKTFVFIFLIYYLQAPISAVLQAMGKARFLFITSTIFNILRIILIFAFSAIPSIGLDSILYAILITMVGAVLINFFYLLSICHFKFDLETNLNILILTGTTLVFDYLLKTLFHWSYLINSLILLLYFALCSMYLKLIDIESFHLIKKNPKTS